MIAKTKDKQVPLTGLFKESESSPSQSRQRRPIHKFSVKKFMFENSPQNEKVDAQKSDNLKSEKAKLTQAVSENSDKTIKESLENLTPKKDQIMVSCLDIAQTLQSLELSQTPAQEQRVSILSPGPTLKSPVESFASMLLQGYMREEEKSSQNQEKIHSI